ncbi:CinA family protein [Dyadobacter fanqingshengii]|uniref:Nicotinamide-nucleotide amidohydrolase family protein n=1 Tax=Dyadobacter fanqingshengii TaxID=2906443 RepID=A0A9X1PBE3_9BACT|nr:nicotinamide-nucleotide amidohydrolase family protein [Dyadobacter fanqingshengii]MCF0040167.1 nicotinamide-nucleotide amidohydrolase family protein [Dyadobacter fanqingshengii]USJ38081.1 nicotinamide-nucleotide amidohydrolase family protein [Dyadobacter fanqingshengii]
MPSQIIKDCSSALAAKRLTVAFVESASAGRLSAEFSLCPESGKVLKGGLVCYDASLKIGILRVPKKMIDTFTPESAEVTHELAERLQRFIPADIHIAITGLTTPGGSETAEKPVGTIFIHAYLKGKSVAVREVFSGSPEEVVLKSIDRVAKLILDEIPN